MDAPRRRQPVLVGQFSEAGRKALNQDFHGLCIPAEPLLGAKGIAVAVADGISTSSVSRVASETAVASFLEDYYSTPETWPVKKSAQRVMSAANSWLYSQTRQRRHGTDQGYVCGMSVLILKGATAHILHVGDARISRLRGATLEPLTEEHRVWLGHERSCLTRALGIGTHLEIDYHTRGVAQGDVFVLATDGVHEHVPAAQLIDTIHAHGDDLDAAARAIVGLAYEAGSPDNLTVQLLRVTEVPEADAQDLTRQAGSLPCPPLLIDGETFEGYEIERSLHASARSHVYLARREGSRYVIKIPSLDLRHDPAYLERLLLEEWMARRIHSRHVVSAAPPRPRASLYTVSEYIEGQTLAQWMAANPRPAVDVVIGLVEQAARGLQAFHRLEILHRDLRPENLMITPAGDVKIIDMGSAIASSQTEAQAPQPDVPGAVAYAAPEYFLGQGGSTRADLYSLGVIAYQMLTGRLPYGTQAARVRSRADLMRLRYVPAEPATPRANPVEAASRGQAASGAATEGAVHSKAADGAAREGVPPWFDAVLAQAVHPDPERRFQDAAEFIHALRHPGAAPARLALIERDPLLFWKGLCLLLAVALLISLAYR